MTPSEPPDAFFDFAEEVPPPSVSAASSLESLHLLAGNMASAATAMDKTGSPTSHRTSLYAPQQQQPEEGQRALWVGGPLTARIQQGAISPAVSSARLPSGVPLPLPSSMRRLGVPSSAPLTMMPGTAGSNSIPEFLYQLTKMLTEDNGRIIEWTNGKIEVHNPHRLETEVLRKYFRHSKFASFQRQLNYFGFRKQAGKGKMAPCSYVNESPLTDLSSILLIKRKASATLAGSAKDKERSNRKETIAKPAQRKVSADATGNVNPVLAGILYKSNAPPNGTPLAAASSLATFQVESQKAVAKAAVGRGIRHSFMHRGLPPPAAPVLSSSYVVRPSAPEASATTADQRSQNDISRDSLTQLANNYRNSLGDLPDEETFSFDTDPTPLSQLQGGGGTSPYVSLLDLAMIPEVEGEGDFGDGSFNFVDFPNPEVRPGGGL